MQIRAAFRTIEFVLPVPSGSPVVRSGTVQCELGCWRSWLRWLHRGHRQFASQAVRLLPMPAAEGKATALVHVLSGTIRAPAWGAATGRDRSRQSWVQPTLAQDTPINNGR